MGRVKLKIKRLESTSNRQVTYSKRRNGILKKARELSILCDIEIILLMFSPTGRPTLFHGARSNIEEVIAKFAQLTPQERAKRKLESLEALKKTFKKLDHDVNLQDFLGASTQTIEELTNQARLLQAQLTEVHKRLSSWSNPDKVDSTEHLRQMEDSLRESLNRIRVHKVGLLLLESLLLLSYFSLFHPGNQAVLRWGKSPTIIHKMCDLPYVFFSDPELMPILAGTLVAACYGCEQNKGVVQQEVSMDMLLSLLRSCRNALPGVRSNSILDSSRMDDSSECNTVGPESRKLLMDVSLRPSRHNARSTRGILGKGVASGNSLRLGKMRNQRDSKGLKTCEEMALKHHMQAPETPSALMLHFRFPSSFMDSVDASRPRDPRSCQVDARLQPRMISGSVNPAKDVWTECPDTPSDGFVSHDSKDQSVAFFGVR